jgi:hypothetical protein
MGSKNITLMMGILVVYCDAPYIRAVYCDAKRD